jgi:hypothetical protein
MSGHDRRNKSNTHTHTLGWEKYKVNKK